ncbi:MAG: Hsp20/alpha crystallin family protein [Planctomycetota bacterium]|nr:Hsp20/alpha crystallin family protein [Planctomycetota bacterium]
MMFLTDLRPMTSNLASSLWNERAEAREAETFTPRVSLFESVDAYWVRMEIPGVAADKIELTFERDQLLVKGEKALETLDEGMRWLRNERPYGAFERTFRFTAPVAVDGVQAETRDGILTIRVAKAPESLPKKINVIAK